MKNLKPIIYAALAVLIIVPAMVSTADAQRAQQPTIVEIALDNDAFSTLVAAVVKADLVDTLNGRRQFTVFAPTNDAFDGAAEAVLGEDFNGLDLVEALDAETLTDILLYHVVPGNRYSNSILPAKQIRTMNGEFLKVDGTTLVGNETSADLVVDLVDIPARNGVIHVIDFVLLP